MKSKIEMHEGPEAFNRFKNAMQAVLAVSHEEIQKRIAKHRAKAAKNPNRRGPKRKSAKTSASRASDAS